MLGQTFDLIDIARVIALGFIEILLSADNAIVLGVLSRALPEIQRRKALYIGVISAFFLRAGAIFLVSFILHSPWLEILGAFYLLYLAIKHFIRKDQQSNPASPATFWKTVFLIEFFDLAFALDSIIAGIAFIATPSPTSSGLFHPKLWIVYVGGMFGLLVIRYAADFCSRLIDRFPQFEKTAYLLIGLIGIKLLLDATIAPPGLEYFFWIAFAILFSISFLKLRR